LGTRPVNSEKARRTDLLSGLIERLSPAPRLQSGAQTDLISEPLFQATFMIRGYVDDAVCRRE
jgi:hypothetical protein